MLQAWFLRTVGIINRKRITVIKNPVLSTFLKNSTYNRKSNAILKMNNTSTYNRNEEEYFGLSNKHVDFIRKRVGVDKKS
jgi:hypothetical protein